MLTHVIRCCKNKNIEIIVFDHNTHQLETFNFELTSTDPILYKTIYLINNNGNLAYFKYLKRKKLIKLLHKPFSDYFVINNNKIKYTICHMQLEKLALLEIL